MVPKRELLWIVALVAVVAALVGGVVGVAVAIAADGMPMMGDGGMGSMMDGHGGMDGGHGRMSEAEFGRMHDLCHQMMEDHGSEGTG